MSVVPLITIPESDTYNALSADWLALADEVKDAHIYNASVYMQTRWDCVDVVWSDPTTLDDDLKRACSYYAEADRLGSLNPDVSDTSAKGRITEETGQVDTLRETIKYSDSGALVSGDNPLAMIDSIMSLYCTPLSATTCQLLRV